MALCGCSPYIKQCEQFPTRNNYTIYGPNSGNYFENELNSSLQNPFAGMLLSQLQNYNATLSCDYEINPQIKKPIPSYLKMMDQTYDN